MEAIGCHETGCMNPFPNHPNPPCPPPNPNPTPQALKSWQRDCLTGADCTSFHLLFFFSSPLVFNSFSIQRRLSSQRVSNAVPQKISWCWNWPETHPLSSGQKFSYMTNYCLHWLKSFVASLDDSGHNVEWLGGAASHNLRKVEAMQPLWKCTDVSKRPLLICEKAQKRFSCWSFVLSQVDRWQIVKVWGRGLSGLSVNVERNIVANWFLHNHRLATGSSFCKRSSGSLSLPL